MRRFLLALGVALLWSVACQAYIESASVPTGERGLCDYTDLTEFVQFRAVEVGCLEKHPGKISRAGEMLIVRLDNGETKEYATNHQACDEGPVNDCSDFLFFGYIQAMNSVVLRRGCYEGCNDILFVSLFDGATVKAESIPHFSPKGDMFVVVAASDATELDTPDVWLFEIRDQRPVAIFQHSNHAGYQFWSFVEWRGNAEVTLRAAATGPKCREAETANVWDPEQITVSLAKVGDEWRFVPGLPCH